MKCFQSTDERRQGVGSTLEDNPGALSKYWQGDL